MSRNFYHFSTYLTSQKFILWSQDNDGQILKMTCLHIPSTIFQKNIQQVV